MRDAGEPATRGWKIGDLVKVSANAPSCAYLIIDLREQEGRWGARLLAADYDRFWVRHERRFARRREEEASRQGMLSLGPSFVVSDLTGHYVWVGHEDLTTFL